MFISGIYSQTTEGEKILRTVIVDTTRGWLTGGLLNTGISQTSLTNWAAGGQNSFAVNGLFSLFANYKANNIAWDNSLDVGYGLLKQGSESDFMKTDDKIDFTSKFGRKASEHWYYAALLNFKTQMTAGYNYPNDSVRISDFLTPAYTLVSIGMDYKPNKNLSVFVAPLTGKITYVNDQELANVGAFGVEKAEYDSIGNVITKGKKTRAEFGGYLKVQYKKEIMKNVSLETKVDAFSNYLKEAQNIDINWETLISLKVNKFISTTIATHLIYDDDIIIDVDKNDDGIVDESGPRIQFKEVLSVGFSYKF